MIFFLPNAHQSVITVSDIHENLLRLIKRYKLNINKDDILKIVRNRNINKTMIMIFYNVENVENLWFSVKWSVLIMEFFQTHRKCLILYKSIKTMTNTLNNYDPVSLLPLCGKIFQRTIFIDAFPFLENNNLLLNSLVLGRMIPVSFSFYQLFMYLLKFLTIIQHLK